jgi:16S rRNA C967 or C1407 C5-methylase (RsmB/RsmF family)
LQTLLGADYESVLSAFSLERKWSFRLNLLQWEEKEVLAELSEKWIQTISFDGLPHVYFFDKKDDYAMKGTDAFYSGKIYLQSISSTLPALVLDPKAGESVLDVCAAPGSKTTQMAMLMNDEWSILALEQNPIRYEKLMHNCTLQWATIVEGKRMDAKVYLDPLGIKKFDKILLDAPCSAEWRITLANEKTYGFWSLENIKKKANVSSTTSSLVPSHDWTHDEHSCTLRVRSLLKRTNEWYLVSSQKILILP